VLLSQTSISRICKPAAQAVAASAKSEGLHPEISHIREISESREDAAAKQKGQLEDLKELVSDTINHASPGSAGPYRKIHQGLQNVTSRLAWNEEERDGEKAS
jgi:hypothetical protein